MDAIMQQWYDVLSWMLADWRRQRPNDRRSDQEIITSFMERFAAQGLIRKEGGRYLLGSIIPDTSLPGPWQVEDADPDFDIKLPPGY